MVKYHHVANYRLFYYRVLRSLDRVLGGEAYLQGGAEFPEL